MRTAHSASRSAIASALRRSSSSALNVLPSSARSTSVTNASSWSSRLVMPATSSWRSTSAVMPGRPFSKASAAATAADAAGASPIAATARSSSARISSCDGTPLVGRRLITPMMPHMGGQATDTEPSHPVGVRRRRYPARRDRARDHRAIPAGAPVDARPAAAGVDRVGDGGRDRARQGVPRPRRPARPREDRHGVAPDRDRAAADDVPGARQGALRIDQRVARPAARSPCRSCSTG